MAENTLGIVVVVSVIVVWAVVFVSAIRIARKRGKILTRMEAINNELSELNQETWDGKVSIERREEIDQRFEVLNAEFDDLILQFEGRK